MKYENAVAHLVRWRNWWRLASIAFAACLLSIMAGSVVPWVSPAVIRMGFSASIVCFFVGFACLAWQQRNGDE